MADYYDIVTADSTTYSADETQWPSADGGLLYNLVSIVEPVGTIITADTTLYSADNTVWPTADGGILDGAREVVDATVEAAELPIGGGVFVPPLRLRPVIGVGYGILPQLEGEAHGIVTIAGAGLGKLPRLGGSAAGSVGVAGRSAPQLVLPRASAFGAYGQIGAGAGTILKFHAAAAGRHDDDEATVMAFLLAA